MARPRQDPDAEPTRDRILRVARAAFAADGFGETSLARIAKAAGVSAPTVMHHFGSKDGLYDEVVRAFYADLMGHVVRALAAPDDVDVPTDAPPERAGMLRALRALTELPDRDRDLLVTLVTEVVYAGRGADMIADSAAPLVELLGGAAGERDGGGLARPVVLTAALLVLFAIPSARTPPGLERLRERMWCTPDEALAFASELLGLSKG